jgi:PAS domain S-box-containing protein
MNNRLVRVLVVEDNPGDLRLLQDHIAHAGEGRYDVAAVERLAQAQSVMRERAFDLLLLDLSLPDSHGIDTFRSVRGDAGDAAVLILSGLEDDALAAQAVRDGAQDYLIKGQLTQSGLLRAMRHALERKQLETALRTANTGLERTVSQRTAELVQTNRELHGEIAERERTEAELQAALAEVSLIFDNAVIGIAYVKNRTVLRANPRFCEMFGYPLEGVIGRSTETFYPTRAAFEALGTAAYPVLAKGAPYATEIQFRRSDGRLFWAQLHGRLAAPDASIWVFEDIDERKLADDERAARLARVEDQLQAVGTISLSDALVEGDVERLAREVTEAAARATGVERANVWLFNDDETELRCIDLYEATPGAHSSGMVLNQSQFENELRLLRNTRYVNADDPLTDPRTAGYVEAYLKPLRITSMLDAVVHLSGRNLGLLCLEHVDRAHHWEDDEIAFACQLTDKVALAITNRQRLQAQHHLARINRTLTVLSKCNGALVRATDEQQLLTEICGLLTTDGGYPLAWVGYRSGMDALPPHIVSTAGPAAAYADGLEKLFVDESYPDTAIGQALARGGYVAHDFRAVPRLSAFHERADRFKLHSVIALPLLHAGSPIGVLAIYSGDANPFDADECRLLEELAGDLAYGITNLRTRAERDASQARAQRALEQGITAIGATLEMRDPYTAGHQHRVAELAAALARGMGLDEGRTQGLRLAATIHDIGKIQVPSDLLSKPARLTPTEFELFKIHPRAGYDILKGIEFPWPVADIVLQHHERLDASGYPDGLKGDAILLEARILAVADVVEAMASHRPYRPARGLEAALAEISANRGRLYDAATVDACLRLFRDQGYRMPD